MLDQHAVRNLMHPMCATHACDRQHYAAELVANKKMRARIMAFLSFISRFLTAHQKLVYTIGLVASFIIGTLFGDGAIFQWAAMKQESEKALQDRVALETDLISQLRQYESSIHELVPRYVSKRDHLPPDAAREEQLEYSALRYQLAGLFVTFNKLEAKLSQLERRGAQFLLPAQLIPPAAPRIALVQTSPSETTVDAPVRVDINVQHTRDEVDKAVSDQLALMFDEYDESFRDAYYLRSCKLGSAVFCTGLASLRSGANIQGRLAAEDRDLYDRACSLGNAVGCEMLGFNQFYHRKFLSAEQWLLKSCELSSATGCGFLGSLYASKLLGDRQNTRRGREYLEKGCELRSDRSCYYLAILLVSGLVERDLPSAQLRLQAACGLGLDQACNSLQEFDRFQVCSPDAIHSVAGDASLTIECKEPTPGRSAKHDAA